MTLEATTIGSLARAALEREARLTPKPGLVDAENSGAHSDMNLALLLVSAAALEPFFALFAAAGMADAALLPDGRLNCIREDGIAAEQAMFLATNGVNTHKGALFLLGALCYAAGYCAENGTALLPETVCAVAGRVCRGVTQELGERAGRAFASHGARGARGEAEDGFPRALFALETFRRARARSAAEHDAWLLALMRLMEVVEDANVLARCGDEIARALKARAGEIAARYPSGGEDFLREIRVLGRDCMLWRASPGGAADLLACAMFLLALSEITTA